MKRREFVAAGLVLTSGVLMPGCRWRPHRVDAKDPVPIASLIDVHCHIFNGSDLPSVRFLKIVVAKAYPKEAVRVLDIEDPDVLDGVIAIFLWLVGSTRAPTAWRETKVLDKAERAERRNATLAANEDAVIGALAQMVAEGAIAVSDNVSPAAIRKVRSALFAAAGETGLAVSDAGLTAAESRVIAEKAYRSSFDLGLLLRWFALFTRYRYVLAEQLAADYRRQAYTPQLLCPALIDYDLWLGQYVDGSPLPEQVRVMGRLARRKSGPVVHGYVAFDPLRQAAYDLGKVTEFDPLKLVQTALLDEGFVGVKLYPPMGFRATGNVDPCQSYPDLSIFREIMASSEDHQDYSACTRTPAVGSAIVGAKLDAAMERLFEVCSIQHACIIAHANNSNGSNEHYGLRADPAYWVSVFKRWPALHVTLAHFGSFETESVALQGIAMPEGSWEWALGQYLKAHPEAPVFADISFLSEIAGKSPVEISRYAAIVRRWIDAFDPTCRHLLFGSDWLMLGASPAYDGYVKRVDAFFRNAVGLDNIQMSRLFNLNAAHFLGLREGDAARDRLRQFYAKHNVPISRLPSFEKA